MSLAHEVPSTYATDEDSEPDLTMALTREELRTMATQVTEMYQSWDKTQLGLAKLTKHQRMLEERQDRLEDRLGALSHGERHSVRRTDPEELDNLERTGTNHDMVKMPIGRAGKLLDSEKREAELSELVARYVWWKGTTRDVAVGAFKIVGKYVLLLALGWLAHHLWTNGGHL